MNKPVVIIGAGMTGMLAALLLKSRRPATEIIILDHADAPGGHYRGVSLPGIGECDRAMRMFYETGIPELDDTLRSLLPESEWHRYSGNEKDIAGIHWRGALQTHSPYPDLRAQPEHAQVAQELPHAPRTPATNAEEALQNRFGPTGARLYTEVLEKLYGIPARDLHPDALLQPAMNRLILAENPRNDERIAWPDQLTYPHHRPQAALYPRRFGITHVIDAAHARLRAQGVQFRFRTHALSFTDGTLRLSDNTNLVTSLVIQANGLHAAHALTCGATPLRMPACWLAYFRVTRPPEMGRLYHFYCYDRDFRTFRLTHYANYCPGAYDGETWPLCLELWSNAPDEASALMRAEQELLHLEILPQNAHITARAAIRSPNPHALCTLDDAARHAAQRAELAACAPKHFLATGPLVEGGVMLLYEVLRDMHQKLMPHL